MATTPEDVLPAGVEHTAAGVRKGSVAAFVANARALPTATGAERDAIVAQLRSLVAALETAGVFEVFALRDPAVSSAVGR